MKKEEEIKLNLEHIGNNLFRDKTTNEYYIPVYMEVFNDYKFKKVR